MNKSGFIYLEKSVEQLDSEQNQKQNNLKCGKFPRCW